MTLFFSDECNTSRQVAAELALADALGIHVKELRLLARTVFVVDSAGKIVYREIVPEITNEPNYDAALAAVTSAS